MSNVNVTCNKRKKYFGISNLINNQGKPKKEGIGKETKKMRYENKDNKLLHIMRSL